MEGHGGIISIQWQILLVEMISFLILLSVLAKFAFKPLLKFLEERAMQIKLKFEDLEQTKQKIEDMKVVYQRQLDTLEKDTESVIQKAIKEGEVQKNEIISAAKKEATLVIDKGLAEINKERSKVLAQIQMEIANLSFMAASKIIEKSIDEATAQQIVDRFIDKELQRENWN